MEIKRKLKDMIDDLRNSYAILRKTSFEQAVALIFAWTYSLCLLTSISMFEAK